MRSPRQRGRVPVLLGSASSVTSVLRVAGSDGGGEFNKVFGTGFSGDLTGLVKFGNGVATNVSIQSATELWCVTPALAGGAAVTGTVVAVTVADKQLASAFEYLPVATTVYADSDCEVSALPDGNWIAQPTGGGSAAISSDQNRTPGGAKCVKHTLSHGNTPGVKWENGGSVDVPGSTNGCYVRYFVRQPSSLGLTGHVKTIVARYASGNGWGIVGFGPEYGGANNMRMQGDFTGNPQIGGDISFPDDTWAEVVVSMRRSGGTGIIRWWAGMNGALTYMGTRTDSGMGEDRTDLTVALDGYSQGLSGGGPNEVFTDDMAVGNGWVPLAA